jgi:hypothetical protein
MSDEGLKENVPEEIMKPNCKKTAPGNLSRARARVALWPILASTVMAASSASALNINLTYASDATFTAAGLSAADINAMKAANAYTALQLTSRFNDNINVNIMITAVPGTSTLGESSSSVTSVNNYAALRSAMVTDSKTADDATSLGAGGSVPGADPIAGAHIYFVTVAQAKALGIRPDNAVTVDGTFTFGGGFQYTYDPNNRAVPGKIDFIGTALHEFTEIMGRIGTMGDNAPAEYQQMDLFSYSGAGMRGLNKGPGRFFSIDNGTALLKEFNNFNANQGDLQDWASGTNDAFNAFSSDGVLNDLSEVDLRVMDVIGYDRVTVTATGSAANISTRLPVGTGDNLLITGFIITGPGGSTKKLIVRGSGPSTNVPGALANPTLEFHDNTGSLIASNDNWRTTVIGGIITSDQVAEIQASGLAPANDAESALIGTVSPGSYTAQVRGANNTTGIGVAEAFDLSLGSAAKVANVSTRGQVGAGDNLMIAGFIIVNNPLRVVVRGIGPSLIPFGIPNALTDPTLELHDGNGALVLGNDNWRLTQEAEIAATGLQPSNDAESALVITLQPGAYTAQLRGVNNGTGVGVVDVFALP